MTQLIKKSDPRYFELSSDKPYDRHKYKVVMKNGNEIVFDDYMSVQAFWFQYDAQFLSHVDVIE